MSTHRREVVEAWGYSVAVYLIFRFSYLSIPVLLLGAISYNDYSITGRFIFVWGLELGYALAILMEIVVLTVIGAFWFPLSDEILTRGWVGIVAPFSLGCLHWAVFSILALWSIWNGQTDIWFY